MSRTRQFYRKHPHLTMFLLGLIPSTILIHLTLRSVGAR